jgi:two-component system, OmpR family, sensor histidine kinase KdpD
VRELSDVRLRLAALVLLPLIPSALALYHFTLEARQALLAQPPGSQPGSGNALLGQELLALTLLGTLAALCVWIGPRILVDRGKLLSAAEPVAVTRSRSELDRDRGGEIGRLFSSVTHDLRTPLTSIKAASTLMLDHERDLQTNDRRELLETIRDSADVLDRLITNSVQLARSRDGGLRPERIPAALDEVASRTLERMRHSLRDHRVVLVIPEDLPEVPVDVMQLEHALTNVLENAARFSPTGSEIALILSRSNGSVLVRVEDRGEGIPLDQRGRVVEPFVKLNGGGGAGLGLSISRAIAEAHGGHLRIEDQPGGGTAIVLELPVTPAMSVAELTTEALG